jgi:predicted N-acetyltransferase YhbS
MMSHPTFLRRWKQVFAMSIAYFVVGVGDVIYLGNHGFSGVARDALSCTLRFLSWEDRHQEPPQGIARLLDSAL